MECRVGALEAGARRPRQKEECRTDARIMTRSLQLVRLSIGRTSLPGIERLEELRRLDRGVLGHVREQELLVSTDPFFNVPLEWKADIFPSYQARVDRRLQLTHQEQKAIKPVRDELLGLRSLRPVYSQGRFDGDGNFSRQDPYLVSGVTS